MVAVISGAGLGLFNSSGTGSGKNGVGDNASLGQAGEQVYVNSATGNLVIQQQDDFLTATGLDVGVIRTYNSQGKLDDDNGDNWKIGLYRRVSLIGTANAAGSTVIKVFGDGDEVAYTYDASRSAYVSSDGDGANDTLAYNNGVWTWTDGSSRCTETYDSTGRLQNSTDTDGNTITYGYTGALLTQVTDGSSQTTYLDYSGANLTQIRRVSNSVTQTVTRYAYDTSDRLSTVTVDLSPEDNSITDGKTYVTTYTYDGTSKRVASITQGDGTTVSFTYEQAADGSYRVKTTQDGVGRITTYDYSSPITVTVAGSTTAGPTTVTANAGALSTVEATSQAYNLNIDALSGGAPTTIAYQQSNWSAPVGSFSSVDANYTAAQSAGNLNVVIVSWGDTSSHVQSVTDTAGNVYTLAVGPTVNSGIGFSQSIYYAKNIVAASAGSNTVTVQFDADAPYPDVRIAEYSGIDTSNAFDVGTGSVNNWSDTADSGAVTTTNAYDLLVAGNALWTRTSGAGPGFTSRSIDWDGAILEDRIVTEVGSYSATAPLVGMDGWVMQMAAFRAASTEPAYYTVPSGENVSWQSIANTLYGVDSAAAGEALKSALGLNDSALTAGTQLTNLPMTLDVVEQVTVPAYYTVPADANWGDITLAIYGTDDPNAVSALQTETGDPTLTTGLHLTVPLTLSYTSSTGTTNTTGSKTLYLQTDVTDSLGHITTYQQDNVGRLTSVLSPTVGGVRLETDYGYDTDGNITSITQDPSGLNRITAFTYDTNGNLLLSRDADGNTVERTYSSNTNQVLTETRYQVADPDGAGSGQPSVPLTTRYAYDSEDHLRFTVSADGRVTEYRYNSAGQSVASLTYTGAVYDVSAFSPTATLNETQLTTWSGNQNLTQLERVEYAYDFRGNVSNATAYTSTDANGAGVTDANTSITHYVYDQHGQLLQKIDPRGELTTSDATDYLTSYTYDGLGRLLTATDWLSAGVTRSTTTQYDDANNRIVTTSANGLITTTVYDHTGAITSVTNSGSGVTATTTYAYDANGRLRMTTDPTGVSHYVIYDAASRKIADVDGNGTLTEYVYNATNQLVKTVRYADNLPSTTLATLANTNDIDIQDLKSALPAANGRGADQLTRIVYDAAGRAVYSIDEIGAVTQLFYDGLGRVTDKVAYATPVTIASTVNEVLPAQLATGGAYAITLNSSEDRHTRNFYDHDGHLIGTLDGEGYLTEYVYDGAGQLTKQVGYATPTDPTLRSNGTLDELRPATDNTMTTDSPEQDIASYFFYDGEGRQIVALDGEGYMTDTVYDVAGQVSQTIRYGNPVNYTGTQTLAVLRAAATGTNHVTSYAYDGAGRLTDETNYESTQTHAVYDADNHVTSSTSALGTSDARTTQTRYDVLGRVTQALSGEGSAHLTVGMTSAQIDDIWDKYGTAYTYDAAGRRLSATAKAYDPSTGVTTTNITYYYYNEDNQLRFTVNARGEVTENRYNALGQLVDQIAHPNRISITGLAGGLLTTTTVNQLTTGASASVDADTSYTYTLTGQLYTSLTVDGAHVTHAYNAFGEETARTEKLDATRNITHTYAYDQRGLLTDMSWDPSGVNRQEHDDYDAFGRLTARTDQYSNTTRTDYDRLGRTIVTYDALNSKHITTYDAFSRVLSTRDSLENVTTYSYDDVHLTMTVTTPEGISVTTQHNAQGQTVSVTDGRNNTTTYSYDANGQLKASSDSLGTLEARTYDSAGRELIDTDANGVVIRFTYDAANRVLTRTQDANGLSLTTTYEYDGEGRVTTVTEPNGRVTATSYYRDGKVYQVSVDPGTGINSVTQYAYDTAGHVIVVIEGMGNHQNMRRTEYVYDTLGRRTDEYVDPYDLNLHTQYKYDANGNLTRKIDAGGSSTWYVYDADNRLTKTIDALGGVTETTYDSENRVVGTKRYSTAIATAGFGDRVTSVSVPANITADRFEQKVYDRDGHVAYAINSIGGVTIFNYDKNGNVIRQTALYRTVPVAVYTSVESISTMLAAVYTYPPFLNEERTQLTAYDARNRAVFSIDGVGDVTQNKYDANGNLVQRTTYAVQINMAHAVPYFVSQLTDAAYMGSWASDNADPSQDHMTRYWYDGADRLRFTWTADGYDSVSGQFKGALVETRYDDVNRTHTNIAYAHQTGGASQTIISSTATLNNVVDLAAALASAATPTADQWTITQYDMQGRVSSVTDALGHTELYSYDAAGNKISYTNQKGATWNYEYDANHRLILERDPAVAVTTVTEGGSGLDSSLSSATNLSVSIETAMTYDSLGNVKTRTEASNTSQARTTTYDYDALGRQIRTWYPLVGVYNADVTTDIYNTGTDVTRQDASKNLYTQTDYDTLGNAYRNRDVAGNYSYKVYDNLGRVTYEIDAENYVTGYTYDAFGDQTKITRYANAIDSIGDSSTGGAGGGANGTGLVTIGQFTRFDVNNTPVQDITIDPPSSIIFDVTTSSDISSGAIRVDGLDETGAYVSDVVFRTSHGAGHQVLSTTHTYSQVLSIGFYNNQFLDTSVTIYYVPGQAAGGGSVSEYVGTGPSETDVTDHLSISSNDRTITKGYDQLNRVISVEQPQVFTFEAAGSGSGGTTFTVSPFTVYEYNSFGQVVRERRLVDPNATNSYAETYYYYDLKGQKTAQVDALGYLTAYKYDEVGNLVDQVEYAKALSLASVNTGGYGTPTILTPNSQQTDSAGFDRETQFEYDNLNRKTHEVLVHFQYETVSNNDIFTFNDGYHITAYGYDNVGNQTSVTVNGATTYSYYDALGRVIAIAEPTRDRGDSTDTAPHSIEPLTTMKRDAYGNMVEQVQYANGATSADINGFTATATLKNNVNNTGFYIETVSFNSATGVLTIPAPQATSSESPTNPDRVTRLLYDHHGKVIHTEDAAGADHFASYTARGDIAKEWQFVQNAGDPSTTADDTTDALVTIYQYDKLGQQTAIIEPQALVDANGVHNDVNFTTNVIINKQVQYNAFGEVTLKGTSNNSSGTNTVWQEYFDYDQAGRVWRTNADGGVDKIYLYNLAGKATAEIKSTNLSGVTATDLKTLSSPTDVYDSSKLAAGAQVRKETVYDVLGQVKSTRTVTYTALQVRRSDGSLYVHWANPTIANSGQIFQYRIKGSNATWNTASSSSLISDGTDTSFYISDFGNGDYEFKLSFIQPGGTIYAVQTGTFSVEPDITISTTASVIALHSADATTGIQLLDLGTYVGVVKNQSPNVTLWWYSDLSYFHLPNPPDTWVFELKIGNGTWQSVPVTAGTSPDGTYQTLSVPIPDGAFEYRIVGTRNGLIRMAGSGSGTVTGNTVTNTPNALAGASVAVDDGDGNIRWSTPKGVDGVASFKYRTLGSSTWLNPPFGVDTGGNDAEDSVDVSTLSGTYEYQITYTNSDNTIKLVTNGQFTVGHTGEVGTATNTTAINNSDAYVSLSTSQQLDRWGNAISVTDAAGNTTDYRYNQLGNVIEVKQPWAHDLQQTALTFVNGAWTGQATTSTTTERPTSHNYYDLNGRLIATQDGNGNINSIQYNLAGQVVQENHADTGTKRFLYDTFGDQIRVTDEQGYVTLKAYDKVGNLTALLQQTVPLDTSPQYAFVTSNGTVVYIGGGPQNIIGITYTYTYDEAGRRLAETTDGVMVNNVATTVTNRTWYDLNGNVIKNRTADGRETKYAYDQFGLGKQISETNANNDSQTWDYNYFGKLMSHTDMAGALTSYSYDDETGLLVRQYSEWGQNISYSYDAVGQLTHIADYGIGNTGLANVSRDTDYSYDTSGRHTREAVTLSYSDGTVQQQQLTSINYDELGRIIHLNYWSGSQMQTDYSYDLAGNRTRIVSRYHTETGTLGTLKWDDLWYAYDNMNRVAISQGTNTNNVIGISETQGVDLTYDKKGNRISAKQWGVLFRDYRDYTPEGAFNPVIVYDNWSVGSGYGTTTYTYDGLDRLLTEARTYNWRHYDEDLSYDENPEIATTTGQAGLDNMRSYDGASRVIGQTTDELEGTSLVHRTIESSYTADGLLDTQTNKKNGDIESVVTYRESYGDNTLASGYDAAGNALHYQVNVVTHYVSQYDVSYRKADGYQETYTQVATVVGTGPDSGLTGRTYNANNELVQYTDYKDASKNRYFANNQNGQVLSTVQGDYGSNASSTMQQAFSTALSHIYTGVADNAKTQLFLYANGEQVGSLKNVGDGNGMTPRFDVNYTPITASYPSSAPIQVVVQEGDTLKVIARRLYGDANLWYLIADENGLATDPDTPLPVNLVLRAPNNVVSLKNNATTFKPFNVQDAIGDTTPTQPIPPPPSHHGGSGCGIIGQIIMVVVAIIVTIYTAGVASAAIGAALGAVEGTVSAATVVGAVVGGAIGAAAGSIVSQGVGIAIGAQDSFSWGAVGKAAIGGAIGGALFGVSGFDGVPVGGFNGVLGGSWFTSVTSVFGKAAPFVQAAIGGAASSILTQGISVAVGLQDKFSWREVAASTVGSVAGAAAGGMGIGRQNIATRTLNGVISGTAHAAVTGGKIKFEEVLADAFGNAIGNSLVVEEVRPQSSSLKTLNEQIDNDFKELKKIYAKDGKPLTNNPLDNMKLPELELPKDYLDIGNQVPTLTVESAPVLTKNPGTRSPASTFDFRKASAEVIANSAPTGGYASVAAPVQAHAPSYGSASWSEGLYLAGPIPKVNYNLGDLSLTVNGALNAVNSVVNAAANIVGAVTEPFDRYQGELFTLETTFGPAAGPAMAGTMLLGRLSAGIRAESAINAGLDSVTLFRGDRAGTTVIKSYAAREGGYLESQRLISEGNLDDLFRAHAADSKNPASPFISLTSDRRVAEFFAGQNGVVNEFRIPSSRAMPNQFNNLHVPAGPGGGLISEAEYLVPNYIRPSEFVK